MISQVKNLVGLRFGNLVVIDSAGSKPGPSRGRNHSCLSPFWKVQCDCGNIVEVSGIKLKRTKRVSCNNEDCLFRDGKTKHKRSLLQASKRVLKSYKNGAKSRDLEWALSEDQFLELITSPCHYSGLPPSKPLTIKGGTFYWNGIDRIDSSKGYITGNVVPCSTMANYAKSDRPYGEFIAWLDQVAEFRNTLKGVDDSIFA